MTRIPVVKTNPIPVNRDITVERHLSAFVNGKLLETTEPIHTFDHEYAFLTGKKVVECVSADEMLRVGKLARKLGDV